MKNRVWMNLVMAILVAGLFLTASCAKKTVVSDATTIEDQAKTEADDATAKAAAEAERIKAQELQDQMQKERELQEAKVTAAKNRFENQDVHFEYDSSELSSMAKLMLKEKAAWLKENSSVSITIEGHCDERGTTEYNLALGERRASNAKAYLISLGVAGSRLNMVSFGEEQPIDTGKTESAYQKNRRAHFVIE
ncbi:MAG: peptidoglycan-associated lipoprotein Pal [Proteobacteria bacterium]|nr:peptidoglycan-associated lipoprotein Pal [Pseudomonadota bacterium]MBU1581904.1 peptidoglycan-associated lipoprotein Pal [Pseudomonadota bacterium]MBU2455622.1 peptidoglycan-associated lipoprotein Pal [Pseudomonadota bacterium]MBU2631601.1 peptidoglycan-associated lipoprotein Pal [Pseudomonadota bacterium]